MYNIKLRYYTQLAHRYKYTTTVRIYISTEYKYTQTNTITVIYRNTMRNTKTPIEVGYPNKERTLTYKSLKYAIKSLKISIQCVCAFNILDIII